MQPVDTPSSTPCLSAQWVDDNTTQEPISKHLALLRNDQMEAHTHIFNKIYRQ